jgi:hypothetical protein
VVKGVRDRYDGFRRNPWNEIECGSHYARAMASWSLLPALTGFRYSAPEKWIAFGPLIRKEAFRSFFTAGSGWGLFSQKSAAADGRLAALLELRHGRLELAEFRLRPLAPQARYSVAARVGNQAVPASLEKRDGYLCARFARPVGLATGDRLAVEFREIQQKAT